MPLLLLLLAVVVSTSSAQNLPPDDFVKDFMEANKLSGIVIHMSVPLAKDKAVEYKMGSGLGLMNSITHV